MKIWSALNHRLGAHSAPYIFCLLVATLGGAPGFAEDQPEINSVPDSTPSKFPSPALSPSHAVSTSASPSQSSPSPSSTPVLSSSPKPSPVSQKQGVAVKPLTGELFLVNGQHVYLENILLKILKTRATDYVLQVRVVGIQSWRQDRLRGLYQCKGQENILFMKTSANLNDAWVYNKKTCGKDPVRFCLLQEDGQLGCSTWFREPHFERDNVQPSRPSKPFQWKPGTQLRWWTADGQLLRVPWDERYSTKEAWIKPPPRYFLSALLSAVKTFNGPLFLGTTQLVYWPAASLDRDIKFSPERIGAQLRYSSSINSIPVGDGRNVTVNWFDATINYRRNPENVFENFHTYGLLMFSSYTSLGTTLERLGGGLGASINLPKPFLGINYTGKIYSYIDMAMMPIDLSQDNRGLIFSSKWNGIWLFNNDWFVTGDFELRLLNISLLSEDSVVRFQLGIGKAF